MQRSESKILFIAAVAFCISLMVASCAVGPSYRRPKMADDAWAWKNQRIDDTTWFSKGDPMTPRQTSHQDSFKLEKQWWKIFEDDTLNQLMQKAFNDNPTLKTAAYRIMESRALVNNARANYYPVITLDPNISRNRLSGNRPNQFNANNLTQVTLTTISVPVDMTYELDVWGKFRRMVESSRASMIATEADHEVIQLGLTADLTTNYLMLRLTDSQIEIFTHALQLRRKNLQLTQSLFDAGVASKLDVSQAEIEAGTVESQLVDTKRMRALSENAVAALCGIPAMQLRIQPRSGLPYVPSVPPEIPSDLLQHRPDIVEAEQQMISYNAQVGAAQAALLPSVKLTAASAGYLSSRFDNLFDKSSQTWIGGVGISIPIFTGGRNIAQKDAAIARYKESESNYQQAVLTAFREVQDAMASVEYRSQQAVAQQNVLRSAQNAAAMAQELYSKGLTPYVNVILADRAVLDAENAYLSIVGQELINSISLIKALGGGWDGNAAKN